MVLVRYWPVQDKNNNKNFINPLLDIQVLQQQKNIAADEYLNKLKINT